MRISDWSSDVCSSDLILCSAAGLFAIVRRVLIGFDGLVWGAFSLMLLLAWAAIGIMRREVMTDEAIFRLKEAPQWRELSPLHRRRMMLLDWPLFFAIREREVERLQIGRASCRERVWQYV